MIPKFRVWDDENKVMWNIERWHVEDEYFDLIEPDKSVVDPNAKRVLRKQSDVIIIQSTGLLDKNGQEIFEGDVVRMRSGELLPVKLHHGMFIPVCFFYISSVFEREGNVFEHPELLEDPDFRDDEQ